MNSKIVLNGLMAIAIVGVIWLMREPFAATWAWFSDREAVTDSKQRAGIWGPAILAALFILQVFLAFIPGQALMVACGYLYGFWGGFLFSWLSLVIGGEAAYMLARKYGRPFAERWVSSAVLSRWDHAAAGQGIAFFVITLVMPFVPNDAMCYVAGLGTISHRRFIAANLLGRGMACAITSAAGAWGGNLSWQVWAILIVIFLLIGLVYYWSTSKGTRLLLA